MSTQPIATQTITWQHKGQTQTALWHSLKAAVAPKKVILADDTINANAAYKLVCEGTALLWQGDFHQAKQLLQALARRCSHTPRRKTKPDTIAPPAQVFHLHRQAQAQRARVLGMLLIPISADGSVPLRRAPDVKQACLEAYGKIAQDGVMALTELQGMVGAHEWRKKGVYIEALDARIHPYYGVFSPVRGEYLKLVNEAPLANTELAFDIGTGTGVLAAILAKRGVKKIIATDNQTQALDCAAFNLKQLGFSQQVELLQTDMFPEGQAPLILCNPPWLPVRPNSTIERAIYDENSQMLRAFLNGLNAHLTKEGEAWLILSDFAEHLGLRAQHALEAWIAEAGLVIVDKTSIKPIHPKSSDETDPLHPARALEQTSLYRLKRQAK